jgi:preprotein translocase subunit SecG
MGTQKTSRFCDRIRRCLLKENGGLSRLTWWVLSLFVFYLIAVRLRCNKKVQNLNEMW